jgi:hypothetical protein
MQKMLSTALSGNAMSNADVCKGRTRFTTGSQNLGLHLKVQHVTVRSIRCENHVRPMDHVFQGFTGRDGGPGIPGHRMGQDSA